MKQVVAVLGTGFLFTMIVALLGVEFATQENSSPHEYQWIPPLQGLTRSQSFLLMGILFSFLNPFQIYSGFKLRALLGNPENWRFYCIGGFFTSLIAHGILIGVLNWQIYQMLAVILAGLPAGAAGAYAYCRWYNKFKSE